MLSSKYNLTVSATSPCQKWHTEGIETFKYSNCCWSCVLVINNTLLNAKQCLICLYSICLKKSFNDTKILYMYYFVKKIWFVPTSKNAFVFYWISFKNYMIKWPVYTWSKSATMSSWLVPNIYNNRKIGHLENEKPYKYKFFSISSLGIVLLC